MDKFLDFLRLKSIYITFIISFLLGSIILMGIIKFFLQIDPFTNLLLFIACWLFFLILIDFVMIIIAKIQFSSAEKSMRKAQEKNNSRVVSYLKKHKKILSGFDFLKSYLEVIAGYFSLHSFFYIWKGRLLTNEKPNFKKDDKHAGIIINIYHEFFGREYCYGFGVDLLINFFDEKIPYSVYPCKTKEQFFKIISDPMVTSVWIFGHGDHGGSKCGDGFFDHRELFDKLPQDFPKKDNIFQMQCNDGNLPSLVELLADGRGFINNTKNYPLELRYHIKKILNNIVSNDEKTLKF